MTLADYLLGRWLPTQEAALSPTTYARYETSLAHYLLPHLGQVQLRQLHADQLASLYRRLAVSPSEAADPVIRWRPRRSSTCTSSFAPPWSRPSAAGFFQTIQLSACARQIFATTPRRGVGQPRGRPAS